LHRSKYQEFLKQLLLPQLWRKKKNWKKEKKGKQWVQKKLQQSKNSDSTKHKKRLFGSTHTAFFIGPNRLKVGIF